MMIDYDKWREGAPYDLAPLAGITTEERELLTGEICQRSSLDSRDVEALRALATPKAINRIGKASHAQSLPVTTMLRLLVESESFKTRPAEVTR